MGHFRNGFHGVHRARIPDVRQALRSHCNEEMRGVAHPEVRHDMAAQLIGAIRLCHEQAECDHLPFLQAQSVPREVGTEVIAADPGIDVTGAHLAKLLVTVCRFAEKCSAQ